MKPTDEMIKKMERKTERIYLIGYMYSGKSTLGRKLARRLGYQFVDTDELIESRYHITIAHFFEQYSECGFRKIEHEVLVTTGEMAQTVIATGGGTPCHYNNMEWMKREGLTLYLKMGVDALCSRASRSRKPRPLLQGMNTEERKRFIAEQLSRREPYYRQADHTVEAFNPDIEEIVRMIEGN